MILSFPVWYIMLWISILYLGISIFTLSLSIFIPCYCILIVSSSFTVWNDFYFRLISDRLSDISKISMIICRWYVLLIDFHTEKDYFKRENKLFFAIIYFWIQIGSFKEVMVITGISYLISVNWNTYPEISRDFSLVW